MRVPNKQITKKEYEYLVCQAAARGTFWLLEHIVQRLVGLMLI